MKHPMPYGSWPSPITPQLIVDGAAVLTDTYAEGSSVWWSEMRPSEGGRIQIVTRSDGGSARDLLPDGFSARTRVHEYGGGAWWVSRGTVYFVNWDDQRLYRLEAGEVPQAITPEPGTHHGYRYADGRVSPDGTTIVCVREDHSGDGDARNELVAIATDGASDVVVVASGRDFVSSPRLSVDGTRLAWVAWDHPNMPWDDTELWTAAVEASGADIQLRNPRQVAGGADESVMQPEWGPDGELFVVSDRTGWWNIYRVEDSLVPMAQLSAEVGGPAWNFGRSSYGVDSDGSLYLTWSEDAQALLGRVVSGTPLEVWQTGDAAIRHVRVIDGAVVAIAEPVDREPEVVRLSPTADGIKREVLRRPRDLALDADSLSHAEAITFPSAAGRSAHAFYYPPTSARHVGHDEELPPLLVMSHGGPTSASGSSFNLGIQYWTSRGFAVVDVNYGGSTGYGREYRQLLREAWGIVDVEDCCAAAEYLAARDLVDSDRMAIRGGSAGGFTTLAALAGTDTFHAGANHFGVSDMGALATDTHKFESRYLDGLVGPWPASREVYDARSPINNLDGFTCPLITFQGLEDAVVLPNQSERIVAALDDKGVPHAYMAFEGEQHGFRKAETIMAVLDAELSFYGQVFGFDPAGVEEPVTIAHADRL